MKRGVKMKKSYEMIREIFNSCSNNQMRDVFISEVTTDDTDAVAHSFCEGKEVTCEKSILENGSIIYDINTDGIHQRIGFTEL